MSAPRLFTRFARVTPPPEGEALSALGRPGGDRL